MPIKVFSLNLASAATSTSSMTFPDGVAKAFLEFVSLSTACDLRLFASTDNSSFRNVMQEVPQTSSIQVNTFTIASGAVNKFIPIPIAAPYMKVECSTAPASAAVFKVICHYQ